MLNVLKNVLNVAVEREGTKINNDNIQLSFKAGAGILSHYQQSWADIHTLSENNARQANVLSDQINAMHLKITNDHHSLSQIVHYLTAIPHLNSHIHRCAEQIDSIYNSFEKVEKSLIALEDLIEKVEWEQKKIDHRHQFVLYKEKKLAHLEKTRMSLACKHAQDVVSQELKQTRALRERQQVFEEAFQRDVETYKSLGEIPKIERHKSQPSALLEDVQIDFDTKELDKFLEDP